MVEFILMDVINFYIGLYIEEYKKHLFQASIVEILMIFGIFFCVTNVIFIQYCSITKPDSVTEIATDMFEYIPYFK